MCPACVATVAWLAAGSGSAAGGVVAFVVKKLRPKRDAKDDRPPARADRGKDEEAPR
jgi:hypothetical protein